MNVPLPNTLKQHHQSLLITRLYFTHASFLTIPNPHPHRCQTKEQVGHTNFFVFSFSSTVFYEGYPTYITLNILPIYGEIIILEERCHWKQEVTLAACSVAAIGVGVGEELSPSVLTSCLKGFVQWYMWLPTRLSKQWAHYIKAVCNIWHVNRIWNFHVHHALAWFTDVNSLKRV